MYDVAYNHEYFMVSGLGIPERDAGHNVTLILIKLLLSSSEAAETVVWDRNECCHHFNAVPFPGLS
jgi:hypothetical protein